MWTIEIIRRTIKSKYADADVQCFGSVGTGLYLPGGLVDASSTDLRMTLMYRDRMQQRHRSRSLVSLNALSTFETFIFPSTSSRLSSPHFLNRSTFFACSHRKSSRAYRQVHNSIRRIRSGSQRESEERS